MAHIISSNCSRFLHREASSLLHASLKKTIRKGVRDCAGSAFLSGVGLSLLHFFPKDPVACVLGRFIQGAGQASLAWSLGVATSALLEKSFSDECLGRGAKTAVVIAKYALPLLVGLGLSIAFHLPAFATVLTGAYIGTFIMHYRRAAESGRASAVGESGGAASSGQTILQDSEELGSFTPPGSPPSSASRNSSPPSRSSPEVWRLPKKPLPQGKPPVLPSSQTAESILSGNPFAALAEDD